MAAVEGSLQTQTAELGTSLAGMAHQLVEGGLGQDRQPPASAQNHTMAAKVQAIEISPPQPAQSRGQQGRRGEPLATAGDKRPEQFGP